MSGQSLGGYQSGSRRLGGTVHRGPTSDYSVRVLKELRRLGWRKAPAVIAHSADEAVLTYIDGMAATTPMLRNDAAQDGCLAGVARLVREFHDLTEGSDLAGDQEVVCHNDLDPANTIYRRIDGVLTPVALIDWDLAAPGRRIDDLSLICWRFTGVGRAATAASVRRRIGVVLDGYGWRGDRDAVISAMLRSQERARSRIRDGADAGNEKLRELRDAGAVDSIQRDYDWTERNLGG